MAYFDSCREFYNSAYWRELSNQCKVRDNWTCKKCGKKAVISEDKKSMHAHHKIPRRPVPHKTGLDTLDNTETVCSSCHSILHKRNLTGKSEKKNAPPKMFRAQRLSRWKN